MLITRSHSTSGSVKIPTFKYDLYTQTHTPHIAHRARVYPKTNHDLRVGCCCVASCVIVVVVVVVARISVGPPRRTPRSHYTCLAVGHFFF